MKYIKWLVKSLYYSTFFGRPILFRCNICGCCNITGRSKIVSREAHSCSVCGSNLRFRSIISVLMRKLFDDHKVLSQCHDLQYLVLA